MRFRIGLVLGFVLGYYLGAKAGRARYEQITRRLERLRASRPPRVGNRIPRRVRDVAEVRHQGAITTAIAREALELLEVDEAGLERLAPEPPPGDGARERRAP